MPHLNPVDQHDRTRRRAWLISGVICFCVLAAGAGAAAQPLAETPPTVEAEHTQGGPLEELLGVSHDELIMLIVSLAVVIEIVANFGFIQRIPHKFLFLCSFGAFALGAFLTVVESLFFGEVLNFLEHLAYMAGAISLAFWCGRVFGSKQQERR